MSKVIIRSTEKIALKEVVNDVLDAINWTKIITPNASVVIKPNLVSTDRNTMEAANTSMELLKMVVEIFKQQTNKITVGESDMIAPPYVIKAERAFEINGLNDIAKEMGFSLTNFSRSPSMPVTSPLFKDFEMPKCILDCDVFVTMPTLKTHAQGYFTGAIKNLWGCLPRYDRFMLHRHLHARLAELVRILKPQIGIMDGMVAMDGNGPTSGSPQRLNLILGSTDVVALDVTAMRLVGLSPEKARHVYCAHKLGLGEWQESKIEIDSNAAMNTISFKPAEYGLKLKLLDYFSDYKWFTHGVMLNPSNFSALRRISKAIKL